MGGDPAREPPFFFSKPADAVVAVAVADGDDERPGRPRALPYPLATGCVHPEVELVVALGGRESGGANISRGEAMRHVYGFAVGVDLTRRDLQEAAKRAGRPWDCAKGFDGSAPVGDIVERGLLGVTDDGAGLGDRPIWLDVDGDRRQAGTLDQMVWSIPEIISHLSTLFVLRPGDLIFTGTPSGVGPVERGQAVTAGIEGVGRLRFVFE
jgi:fumarylpyruvate hydrolase